MSDAEKPTQQQSNPVHGVPPRAPETDDLVKQVDNLLIALRQLHQVPVRRQ